MSYSAIVTTLKNIRLFPIDPKTGEPGASNLMLATVLGTQIVIGKDMTEGQKVVYFNEGGQLSTNYCLANDLIGYKDPQTGERKGGYFDKNRRVRSQKFRGEKSDGYVSPIESLVFTGVDINTLEDGFMFDTLNSIPICNKYYTPATLRSITNSNKVRSAKYGEIATFKKHIETEQFRNFADKIPVNKLVIISLKKHGTSFRVGHVMSENTVEISKLGKVKNFVYSKILRKEITPQTRKEWTYLHGSRNVIIGDNRITGYYGANEGFREQVFNKFKNNLHKGEVVYGEIVGFVAPNSPIMGRVETESTKDKEFIKRYGKTITYSYGCSEESGEHDIYVYRITNVNEDGYAVDMSFDALVERCSELGIKPVLELDRFIYDGNVEKLRNRVEELSDGPDPIDPTHIREGVVIRIEGGKTPMILKNKGYLFKVMEGIIKNNENYVDTEEVS